MICREHEFFKDIKIIDHDRPEDERGYFLKVYNEEIYREIGIKTQIRESFYSQSHKNVIRGMHFQTPPYGQTKVVHVLSGSVEDVIVDLRRGSRTYQQHIQITLSGNKPQSVYIPEGFAHGFKTLEDGTVMEYFVSEGYHKENDCGIRWNSIGYDWKIEAPVISSRDRAFPNMKDYDSPFFV